MQQHHAGWTLSSAVLGAWAPRPFNAEDEAHFCRDYNAHWKPIRRMCSLAVIGLWSIFIVWDLAMARGDPAYAAVLVPSLVLRLLGLCLLLVSHALFFRSSLALTQPGYADRWLACVSGGLALLITIWMALVPAHYGQAHGYPGQTLIYLGSYVLFGLSFRHACRLALWHALLLAFMIWWARHAPQAAGSLPGFGQFAADASIFVGVAIAMGCLVCWLFEVEARSTFVDRQALARQHAETERRGQALVTLNTALEKANEAAEERLAAVLDLKERLQQETREREQERAQFLASAVHDLRQPVQALSTLLLPVTRAVELGDAQTALPMLQLSHRATQALQDQLATILEVSRLESGAVQPELMPVNVGELVQDLVTTWTPQAEALSVDLSLARPPGELWTLSDGGFLRRILGNLLSNGLKYRQAREAQCSWVQVRVDIDGETLQIVVVDNGIGMSQALIDSGEVFKPFVQLNARNSQADKGVGLGLAIVRKLTALLPSHALMLTSVVGEGTKVSLRLPLRSAPERVYPVPGLGDGLPTDLSGSYVLLVEDDDLVRLSLTHLLQALGMHVDAYADHPQFAQALAELERRPDVVVSDFRLPDGCTAVEVLTSLRHHWDEVPMLVLSGESRDLSEIVGLQGQVCLRKPVDPASLVSALADLIRSAYPPRC